MSTREKALNIFNQLNDNQLEGFIALFTGVYQTVADSESKAQNERDRAFEDLMKKRKHIPDFDEKTEYLSYIDERYRA